jgi:hypothetical protein
VSVLTAFFVKLRNSMDCDDAPLMQQINSKFLRDCVVTQNDCAAVF